MTPIVIVVLVLLIVVEAFGVGWFFGRDALKCESEWSNDEPSKRS